MIENRGDTLIPFEGNIENQLNPLGNFAPPMQLADTKQMWETNTWQNAQPNDYNIYRPSYDPYRVAQYEHSYDSSNQDMEYEQTSNYQTSTRRPYYSSPSPYSTTEKPYYGYDQNELDTYEENQDNGYSAYPEQDSSVSSGPYETYPYSYESTPSYETAPSYSTTRRPVYINQPTYKVTTRRPAKYETTTKGYHQRPQISSPSYQPAPSTSQRPQKTPQSYNPTSPRPSSSTPCPYHSASYGQAPLHSMHYKPKVVVKYPAIHQRPYGQPKPHKNGMVPVRVTSLGPAMRPVYHRHPQPVKIIRKPQPRVYYG